MLKRDYPSQYCPVAATLEVVGERWTLLIIRDIFMGIRRFDDLQRDLGVARNVLQARLERLVEEGILVKRPYQERPPRSEYRLTEKGADLWPVLVALLSGGTATPSRASGRSSSSTASAGANSTTAGVAPSAAPTSTVTEAIAIRTGATRRRAGGRGGRRARRRLTSRAAPVRCGPNGAWVPWPHERATWHGSTPRPRRSWSAPGEVSPAELVDGAIARIETLNPQLNAVIHELFDRARGEAAGPLPDGPFRGVPFLLKDLGAELAGTPFAEGLDFAGDYRSTQTQELTQRFLRRRLRHLRQDQHARARDSADDRAAPLRRHAQPVEHRALDRRLVGRVGGGRGLGHGAGGARQRRRRVHPHSRPRAAAWSGSSRHGRAQLAGAPVRRPDGRARVRARGHPLGTRHGRHPRRHGRTGSRRPLLGAAAARALVRRRGGDAAAGCASPS